MKRDLVLWLAVFAGPVVWMVSFGANFALGRGPAHSNGSRHCTRSLRWHWQSARDPDTSRGKSGTGWVENMRAKQAAQLCYI